MDKIYDKWTSNTETIRIKTKRRKNEKSLIELQDNYKKKNLNLSPNSADTTQNISEEDDSDMEDKLLAATSARGMITGNLQKREVAHGRLNSCCLPESNLTIFSVNS